MPAAPIISESASRAGKGPKRNLGRPGPQLSGHTRGSHHQRVSEPRWQRPKTRPRPPRPGVVRPCPRLPSSASQRAALAKAQNETSAAPPRRRARVTAEAAARVVAPGPELSGHARGSHHQRVSEPRWQRPKTRPRPPRPAGGRGSRPRLPPASSPPARSCPAMPAAPIISESASRAGKGLKRNLGRPAPELSGHARGSHHQRVSEPRWQRPKTRPRPPRPGVVRPCPRLPSSASQRAALAKAQNETSAAPPRRRARVTAEAVARVVATSSTKAMRSPRTAWGSTAKSRLDSRRRCVAVFPVWGAEAERVRVQAEAGAKGMPSSLAATIAISRA